MNVAYEVFAATLDQIGRHEEAVAIKAYLAGVAAKS